MFLAVMVLQVFDLDEFFYERIIILFCWWFSKYWYKLTYKRNTNWRMRGQWAFLMLAGVHEVA